MVKSVETLDNELQMYKEQRIEDRQADKDAHTSILIAIEKTNKSVMLINKKLDDMPKKYVTKSEARIVGSIVTVIVGAIGRFVGKS